MASSVFFFKCAGDGIGGDEGDYLLDVTYYDLSRYHPDFTGVSEAVYSSPTLHPSPYGPWLSVTDRPRISSFTDWFKKKEFVNYKFDTQVLLEQKASSGGTTIRR
jgi:hypothetical protein